MREAIGRQIMKVSMRMLCSAIAAFMTLALRIGTAPGQAIIRFPVSLPP
jgi:hypothetical protein